MHKREFSNHSQKGRLIPTVEGKVKNKRNPFNTNFLREWSISCWKIERRRFKTSQQICKWRNHPETLYAFGSANLIFVDSKLVLAIAEIDFDLPPYSIKMQDLFIGNKIGVSTNKCTESFFVRIRWQNSKSKPPLFQCHWACLHNGKRSISVLSRWRCERAQYDLAFWQTHQLSQSRYEGFGAEGRFWASCFTMSIFETDFSYMTMA